MKKSIGYFSAGGLVVVLLVISSLIASLDEHFSKRIPSAADGTFLFSITGPGVSKSFSKQELLNSKGRRTVVVDSDHAYGGKKMTYTAVPLVSVFEGIDMESIYTVSFKCLDGFSGGISKARILNSDPSSSIAYIAIEEDGNAWPAVKSDKPESAGPFYLIWDHPEKSQIIVDEWPYQLAGLELSTVSFAELYPKTMPSSSLPEQDWIRRGHKVFMTSCFVCHAFNGEGGVKIGPDLNIPHSPSEYLQPRFFSTLVRDPQSLRSWKQARMPGFKESNLSNDDLKSIWLYFNHMAGRKGVK